MNIYSLSIHANYHCGHSGACCTSGWPIPVERDTYARLRELFDAKQLTFGLSDSRTFGLKFLTPPDAPSDTPALTAVDAHGSCGFYEKDRHRCAIHRQVGEELLPVACRQFPRVSLVDPRGTFVNLSHYCPTAASLLFDDEPLDIVESPAAFPHSFPCDPLDARDAMPPLLTPSILLDVNDYGAWEREVVRVFADESVSADEALARVAAATETIRTWKPTSGRTLTDDIRSAFHTPATSDVGLRTSGDAIRLLDLVLCSIPAPLRVPMPSGTDLAHLCIRFPLPTDIAFDRPVRRYLAAKAFGSWLAYQGRGLRTIVRSLEAALALVRIHFALESESRLPASPAQPALPALREAFRRSDELLLHLAMRQSLADEFSRVETATLW